MTYNPVKRQHTEPVCNKLRRSSRLRQRYTESQDKFVHLPSPEASVEEGRVVQRKRKSVVDDKSFEEVQERQKRRKSQHSPNPEFDTKYKDWVTHWVSGEAALPSNEFFASRLEMASNKSSKRDRSVSRSDSTQISERYARLREHGVFMDETRKMSSEGRIICKELLDGNRKPAGFPFYREEHRYAVQQRAATASEAIIQRDILPTLVPSVENLNLMKLEFFKDVELDPFVDEINVEWKRTNTMGGRHPKPDYVAGLKRSAFDSKTWDTLMNYATPDAPVLLSPDMCFALVLAEAKRGTNGIQTALLQAVQGAAIAAKSQIKLFWEAYGETHPKVTELYGKPLIFSVCHNHDEVHLLAHYVLLESGELQFCHSKLALLSLTMNEGKDQNIPNNFVENVYKKCGPIHLKRLREAGTALRERREREEREETTRNEGEEQLEGRSQASTGISFTASQLGLGEDASKDSEPSIFKKPSLPPSARAAQELAEIRKSLEEQRKFMEQQRESMEQQREFMEQQLADGRRREEQQREDFKTRETQLQTQLEQQKAQMDKLMEMLSRKS